LKLLNIAGGEVGMFDNIQIELIIDSPPREIYRQKAEPFMCMGLYFIPKYSVDGNVIHYQSNIKNLIIRIHGNKLIIKNSIHKFHKGNNYSDFYIADLESAICLLSEMLDMNLLEAEVKKIEYGCNIPVDAPENIYNGLIGYQRGYFTPMFDKAREYGKKQYSTDYNIKLYDKQFEVLKHSKKSINPLTRFEKEIKNMRYLRKKGIAIYYLSDLLKKDIWEALKSDLLQTFKKIQKKPVVSFQNLNITEIKEYAICSNTEIVPYVKKNHSRSYARYKKKFDSISENSIYLNFRNEIEHKCSELIKG